MQIQWYPGHMHKASKEIKKALSHIDLIIEIMDARIPFSSENPMIASLSGDKPRIKVLNKSDLADPEITQQWQDYLEQQRHVKALALTTEQPEKVRQIPALCRKMLPHRLGNHQKIHAMIMGIPNVGKSTIINTLAGKMIAKTGNEPAITKMQQRINIGDDVVLFDTPGVLWPNVENKNSGYRLATTGAVRDTAMEYADVAAFAAEYLIQNYPDNLKQRYDIVNLPKSEVELLEIIGKKRGCLRSGGHVDFDKVAKIFLTELRAGTTGRISLEVPAMMEKELVELEVIRAKKAAKKKSRELKKKGRSG
jgi:ribosome biogenesis GTPase A